VILGLGGRWKHPLTTTAAGSGSSQLEDKVTPTNPDRSHEVSSNETGRSRRRVSRPLALAGAIALVVSGGVGASAASAGSPPPAPAESPTPTPTVTVSETAVPIPTPAPTLTPTPAPTETKAPWVPPPAFPGVLHGEFVLPGEDGCGFTVLAQTGEATTLTEDSITVRSRDGFEKAYTIDDSTRSLASRRGGEIEQGDWVSVTARTTGETATAAYVFDLSRSSKKFWRDDSWWSPRQWRPGGKWRTPAPCPTPPVATPTVTPPTPTDAPTAPTETPTLPTTGPSTGPTTEPTAEPAPTVTDSAPPSPAPAS